MKALVLHGFTGSLDTVSSLKVPFEAQGWEVAMPILRGHSTEPDHLHSVHWRDWVSDARKALREIAPDDNQPVVIAGLSLGALLACHLAAEFPNRVKAIALLAPAFAFRSKLLHALPIIKTVRRDWPSVPHYVDQELKVNNTNYSSFPLESLTSVIRYVPVVESLLPYIQCPVGIFFAQGDMTISPKVPKFLESILGAELVTHFTYDRSSHEMLQDAQAGEISNDVARYLYDCVASVGQPSH